MPVTVTRLPTRVEHSTAPVATAITSLYGITKTLPDATLIQLARETEHFFGHLSIQAQSDIYLARVRELLAK